MAGGLSPAHDFVDGLTTQLTEVRVRGEQAIRRDVLIKEHGLSDRQARVLGHILEHGSLTIQLREGQQGNHS